MYTLEIKSDYEELWRYNIIATCGGFDAEGRQLYFEGEEMIMSETIKNRIVAMMPPPKWFTSKEMTITLSCAEAYSLELYLYVIAHTMPEDRLVKNSPPFPMQVTLLRGEEEVASEIYEVNQWGGLTLDLKYQLA